MRTIDAAWRADADNRDVAIIQLIADLGRCFQQSVGAGLGDQIVKARLIDRGLAGIEQFNFGRADVDTQNFMALAGNASGRSTAHVTEAENGDFQCFLLKPIMHEPACRRTARANHSTHSIRTDFCLPIR